MKSSAKNVSGVCRCLFFFFFDFLDFLGGLGFRSEGEVRGCFWEEVVAEEAQLAEEGSPAAAENKSAQSSSDM